MFFAFWLRRRREIHGALLLSTALLFMGIALFFTLIGFVPAYRIEGPETFHRFAEAGKAVALATIAVGIVFFLRNWRNGWPWLLAGMFFLLNGVVQAIVAQTLGTMALTRMVAACDLVVAFAISLSGFAALLWLAWIRPFRGGNQRGRAPGSPTLSKAIE
jgi:hypothetical protein